MSRQDIYCNPLPLPDLPCGVVAREKNSAAQKGAFLGPVMDYRELADPEMLYDKGKWYIFPSGCQAYVSQDLIHWTYQPIEIDADLGYAPSIARCGNRYYLTASSLLRSQTSRMFAADAPLGPYVALGEIRDENNQLLPHQYLDPSLFCDDDGRLYLYWGFGPDGGGVYGIELDAANPVRAIGKAVKLIDFDGRNDFEHFGEYHEHGDWGFIEGEAMFKHNGVYYLQYSGCGTVFANYALGVYRAESPLGPFTGQKTPLLASAHGMVKGTGHGGMVQGPEGTVWQFYTCLLRRKATFERRLGMDKVIFDADGSAHVNVTAVPQSLHDGDLGLVPISVNKPVTVSSLRNEQYGNFANDDCTHTWFAPEISDPEPWLEINFRKPFAVSAIRILWTELNLDYSSGILPEPVRFKVEFFDDQQKKFDFVLDAMNNTQDFVVDFRTFPELANVQYARLTWKRGEKIDLGLTQFTVFGKPRPVRVF